MQKMLGPIDGNDASVMGHGEIFKTNEYGPDVAVQNNIFLVEDLAMTSADPSLWPTQNGYLLGFKNVVSCSNNVIVWLGRPGTMARRTPRGSANPRRGRIGRAARRTIAGVEEMWVWFDRPPAGILD